MNALFVDKDFRDALARYRAQITGFANSIGRYGNAQSEVVIQLDALDSAQVFAFGGYSSERQELAAQMLGRVPSPQEMALFDRAIMNAGANLGPRWIEGEAVDRVVKRLQPQIDELRRVSDDCVSSGCGHVIEANLDDAGPLGSAESEHSSSPLKVHYFIDKRSEARPRHDPALTRKQFALQPSRLPSFIKPPRKYRRTAAARAASGRSAASAVAAGLPA
jgi:hypothetical protein